MRASGSKEARMARVDKFTRTEIFMLESTMMVKDLAAVECTTLPNKKSMTENGATIDVKEKAQC